MDRAAFYAALRARDSGVFGGSLSQAQVNGIEAILTAAEARRVDLRFVAYMLATAYHETGRTFEPIEEFGRGRGRRYGVPAGPYGHIYYGRGLVQLTWLANYRRAGHEIGVDLARHPDKALELGNATRILLEGMEQGWFTSRKLSDYIGVHGADYRGARRVINGTDQADAIAGYARSFESTLRRSGYGDVAAAGATPSIEPAPASTPAPPAVTDVADAPTFWTRLTALLRALFSNPLSRKA